MLRYVFRQLLKSPGFTLVGIAGALVVSRLIQQTVFDIDPVDPSVYVAVSVILLLVAEFASFLPAWRATQIDPMIALRTE